MEKYNDPFEEFEFKPLTEGLGFHKKIEKTKLPQIDAVESTQVLTSPLQRYGTKTAEIKIPSATPNHSTVDEILKSLSERRKYDFKEKEASQVLNAPIVTTYKPTTWDLSASLLDSMLVTALFLACLIILLLVTHVDLFANLYNADEQGMVYISLLTLMAGISWIYLVANRVFLGFTPGEWVFDQRLGKPEEVGQADYSFLVAIRSLLVIATGFISLPILGLLFKRDLVGKLLGIELLKKA